MNVVHADSYETAVRRKLHIADSDATERDSTRRRMIFKIQIVKIRASAKQPLRRFEPFIGPISTVIHLLSL